MILVDYICLPNQFVIYTHIDKEWQNDILI